MTVRKCGGAVLAVVAALVWSGCEQQVRPDPDPVVSSSADALTQDHVLATGDVCVATGKHDKHAFTACANCHNCGGVLQFNATGPAVNAAYPLPTFDATAKTCSSVACHTVPPGTFSYNFPDGTGEGFEVRTVTYGGGAQTTPSWYSTGSVGCSACHGNPPRNYTWHSGYHGGNTGTYNRCELCHLDVVSAVNPATGFYAATGLSTATNCGATRNQPCASLHANGTVNVNPSGPGPASAVTSASYDDRCPESPGRESGALAQRGPAGASPARGGARARSVG